jgi:RHS repeat-associated protein
MHKTSGDMIWSADLNSYGEVQNLRGKAEECPFRFPGQYEDAETGLNYNRFRYFDTRESIYVSQDPIGFNSGILNLTAYVDDPNTFADPLGLKKCGPKRTKHTRNRHTGKKKHNDASKYKHPRDIKKLEDRTMSQPDRIHTQRKGRIRYEKDFGRKIGTKGETIQRVVYDPKKDKIITSFPEKDFSIPE